MKTYFKKSWLVTSLAVMLMLSIAGHAFGSGTLREIKANLNSGLNIILHGERFIATDPDTGTELLPITYQGRTYLPLRSVAEANDLEVEWDGRTQTIYLGDSEGSAEQGDERVVQVNTEYAKPADKYHTASGTPHILNRGPDKTFAYGFAGYKEFHSTLQLYIDNDFEFETFKATIWVDANLENSSGIKRTPEPRIVVYNERNEVIYSVPNVEYADYYDIEVDISKVETVRVIVDGNLSVIGDPVLVK
ncbi:stalk domain-containing protein [Paenibacillus chungangensis]|uniref:Stalk domain-containing protein n=1 Tax=Paenibacillus chungangensis TaxID=696535 RepID=A0ABW3HUC0_9BACL